MPRTFTYSFDELPLVMERGFEAGLVAGEAEISYTNDVWDFGIQSIALSGWKSDVKGTRPVPLDEANPLYGMIYHRLEHDLSDTVQEAIRQQLVEDRNDAAEIRAEARRDDMRMGVW